MKLSEELNPVISPSTQQPPFDGIWRLTECIGCPAAPLHRALGCDSRKFDAQTLALFYEGILHEKDLKERAREMGHTILDFPDGSMDKELPIACHVDGVLLPDNALMAQEGLSLEDEVFETKSVYDAVDAETFIQEHPQYRKQVQGYMRIHDKARARIIAKNRRTGWVLDDIIIVKDLSVTDPIWTNVRRINDRLLAGLQSCSGPWLPDCSSDFVTRLFCPYNGVHCQVTEAKATVELDGLLLAYAALKPDYDRANSMIASIRDQVKELMKEAGLRRIEASDGTKASAYEHSFASVNKDLAKEFLTPDQFAKVFGTGRTPSVRITVAKLGTEDDEGVSL